MNSLITCHNLLDIDNWFHGSPKLIHDDLETKKLCEGLSDFLFFPPQINFQKFSEFVKHFFMIEEEIVHLRASRCPDLIPICLGEHVIHVHTLLSPFEDHN